MSPNFVLQFLAWANVYSMTTGCMIPVLGCPSEYLVERVRGGAAVGVPDGVGEGGERGERGARLQRAQQQPPQRRSSTTVAQRYQQLLRQVLLGA